MDFCWLKVATGSRWQGQRPAGHPAPAQGAHALPASARVRVARRSAGWTGRSSLLEMAHQGVMMSHLVRQAHLVCFHRACRRWACSPQACRLGCEACHRQACLRASHQAWGLPLAWDLHQAWGLRLVWGLHTAWACILAWARRQEWVHQAALRQACIHQT